MAKKYFGTDGVRGEVGQFPITPDFVLKLGYAAGQVLVQHDSEHRPTVLIGKDTRISGYMLEAALVAGWQWIKGVFRDNPLLAAFTGPIGAIIGLIANWDRVKIALVAGWQWISVRFADNPIVRAINAAIDHFGRFGVSWESIRVLAGKVWEGIKSAIVGHIQSIIGWVSRAIDKFQSFFGTASKASSVRMPAAPAAGIPAAPPARPPARGRHHTRGRTHAQWESGSRP